jgi:hypothetical protein
VYQAYLSLLFSATSPLQPHRQTMARLVSTAEREPTEDGADLTVPNPSTTSGTLPNRLAQVARYSQPCCGYLGGS